MGIFMVTIPILSTFIIYELYINSEQVVNDSDPSISLKNLKIANPNKIIIGHLKINSIRNKFESLTYIIDKKNIVCVRVCSPSILYVHEHIQSRPVNIAFCPKIEAIVIEINLKKEKNGCLLAHITLKNHLDSISMQFDELHKKI